MPKLLDSKTFIQFFELDKNKETANLSTEAIDRWLMYNDSKADLCKWAEAKYPNVPSIYYQSFAGLIEYFATGAYGGYGTENLQKERFTEHKAYEFYTCLHENLSSEQMTIVMIYFIASHLIQKVPLEQEVEGKIKRAIELLEESKKNFKSKQVAEARKILENI